jgi:APA family basic amino acid/polyamine antiporter
MVTLLGQSRLPMVLAEDGLFPTVFGRLHPRFGTPWASLLVGAVVLTLLCVLPFASLTGLYALVQAIAYLLIFAALFRLRGRSAPRPEAFRIPLEARGLLLMIVPSLFIAGLVVVHGVWHGGALDRLQVLVSLSLLLSGPATYFLVRRGSRP